MEVLGSADYIEIEEEEALNLAIANNKGIVEIIEEEIETEDEDDEVDESEEELNFMICEDVSIGSLRGETFTIDNEQEKEIGQDWIMPIVHKKEIYQNSIFKLKSKFICERMEGDLEVRECETEVGEINLINYDNIVKNNKNGEYKYIHIGSIQIQITPLFNKGHDVDIYAFICDTRQKSFGRSIITGIKSNLCGGPIGFNCRPGYYVSLGDGLINRFLKLKLKTVGIDMHESSYPLIIYWKIIYKLDNTVDPRMQHRIVEADRFEPINGIQIDRIKPKRTNPNEIKLDKRWIEGFSKTNLISDKKHTTIQIDDKGKIILADNPEEGNTSQKHRRRSMDLGKLPMADISINPPRKSVSERKITGYRTVTTSVPVYEEEENLMIKIRDDNEEDYEKYVRRYHKNKIQNNKVFFTNENSIYIPVTVCLEDFNSYELYAYVDSGCSICFGKRTLFPNYMWKKQENPIKVTIANNENMYQKFTNQNK
mgnify:CR=1 FL=1